MRTLTTECTKIAVSHVKSGNLTTQGVTATMRWDNGSSVCLEGQSDALMIRYTTGAGERRQQHYDRIGYRWTPCHYGGSRLYLVCPHCQRSCMAVYGCAPFACRKCHDLAYPSETTSGAFRLYDTGQAIAHKMAGQFVALDEPFPDRPKGMHHKTYAAKRAKWERMTAPARAMMDAMLHGDASRGWFVSNDSWRAKRLKEERRKDAQKTRVADYVARYWEGKETPAKGLR